MKDRDRYIGLKLTKDIPGFGKEGDFAVCTIQDPIIARAYVYGAMDELNLFKRNSAEMAIFERKRWDGDKSSPPASQKDAGALHAPQA